MQKNGDAHARAVFDALRRLVRALRETSRAAEHDLGVSGAQLFVLQALSDVRAMSVGELAERTLTHQSSVSTVVSALVTRGLVRRGSSPKDGRRVDLSLTVKGRALLARAPHSTQNHILEGLGRLSVADRRALASRMTKLVDVMGLSSVEPRMLFDDSLEGRQRR